MRFSTLSSLAVHLLTLIGEAPGATGQHQLQQLAALHHLDPETLAAPGAQLLLQFLRAGVIGPLPASP